MSTKKKATSRKTMGKTGKSPASPKKESLTAKVTAETEREVSEVSKKTEEAFSSEALFSNEVVEIKEIIERVPEESKESKKEKKDVGKRKKSSRQGSVFSAIAGVLALLCYPFVAVWKGAQKGTRYFLVGSTVFGVVMTIGVVILAVRLADAKKELQSVQTMSIGLQEDLDDAMDVVAQKDLLLFAQSNSSKTESVPSTPVPTPTSIPTPIPSPTPVPPKYVVCVDAGHGDWDGGAGYYEQREDGLWYCVRKEKDDNLRMAKWFGEALEEYGIEVVLTRDTDVYLTLDERTDIANEAKADALISFHRNSYDGNNSVKGVEFWIHSSKPEGARILAYDMLAAIMEVGGMQSRGVKWGSMSSTKEDYAINREAEMTSMIVELGFISCETDNEAYDTYGKQYAEEMAKAVFEWLEEEEAEKQKVAAEE